jgi:hypothetical protein
MLRKLSVLLSVLALAFAVTACGDDEEPASGGTEPTQTAEPAETGGEVSDEQAQAFVEACKEQITAQSSLLSAKIKSELEETCEKAGSGDEAEAREAIVDVCVQIIEETVPEDSGREEFSKQCETAAP